MTDAGNRRRQLERGGAAGAAAVAMALTLVSAAGFLERAPTGVFLSIDGGMKLLMTDQLARGELGGALAFRHADELEPLWRDGMRPVPEDTTQVHREGDRFLPGHPWPYPALNVPFYALAGPRGMLALPFLGVVLIALAVLLVAWRARWGPLALGAAVLASVVATPIVVYAGIVWEHPLAVALSTLGFAELALPPGRRARAVATGACLGAACWLRPECGAFALAVGIALAAGVALVPARRRAPRRWLAYLGSAAAVFALYLLFNQLLYGTPAGLHGQQSLGLGMDERLERALELGEAMQAMTLAWSPHVWLFLPLAGAVIASPRLHRTPGALEAVIVLPLFVAFTCLIVPNTGGRTIAARYLLPIYPLLALVIGAVVHGARGAVGRPAAWLLLPLVAFGLYRSAVEVDEQGHHELDRSYVGGTGYCVAAIRGTPATDVLAFNHGFYGIHAAGAWGDRRVLLVEDGEHLARAMRFAAERDRGLVVVTTAHLRHALDRDFPPGTERVAHCDGSEVHRVPPEVARRATRRTRGDGLP